MPMSTNANSPSFLGGGTAYIEDLYARFLRDPESVDPSWREYFAQVTDSGPPIANGHGASWARPDWPILANGELVSALIPGMEPPPSAKPAKKPMAAASEAEVRRATLDSIRALMMIRAFRVRGHLQANLDPLGLEVPGYHPELDPATYGFKDDLDRPIFIDNVLGLESATVREIVEILRRTYCSTIGVEFMHINEPGEKAWLQARIEGREKEVHFTEMGKRAILQKLIEAEGFEKFLNVKYTGTKRFGLDGGESLIPGMEQILKRGGQLGLKEVVVGMPHRGRLNVLANVMLKPFRAIFNEFQGGSNKPEDVGGSGDVKYHLGSSADRDFDGNVVHLSLTANPSHLEAVDPVVLGKARAKEAHRHAQGKQEVMPLLLHGDAAFAGQGLVAECFGLSGLKGYRTGGTIHIIVNNQIGFTTSPRFSRSSPYPSDTAKMVQAPIFHVNGDDPEAVVHVFKIATEFRQEFQKDVVIDMFCYRRFGHNEGDEPAFTQPIMYRKIHEHPTVATIYGQRLTDEGVVKKGEPDEMVANFHAVLEQEFEAGENYRPNKADWLEGRWSGFKVAKGQARRGDTGVEPERLKEIGKILTTVPEGFNIHRTLARILKTKEKMFETGQGFDWATAEALAFGSLIEEGFGVRLSGQDSTRGTFSQRHSAFIDQETEERYIPLAQIGSESGFEVIDSMLSEAAVLGFEYGYTMAEPNALVLWEAQFGDFANGAQVIIDQFIFSGESKWLRMSGLVMLLPHGYEGMGPEHSSARLERYLQLCAEDNVQVANCTTPANYFHILRRQLHRTFRKPLILMTPKSLLRHKLAVSRLDEMAPGTSFHRVLWDDAEILPDQSIKLKPDEQISRVILCTGKVYYDLYEKRNELKLDDVYIMRLEQLYPFPAQALEKEIKRFSNARIIWCQEEPRNMGAWDFVDPRIERLLGLLDNMKAKRPVFVGRRSSASTATGLAKVHAAEQQALVAEALEG
jgi:2-oxoglutarate dehydrogenase E1 component